MRPVTPETLAEQERWMANHPIMDVPPGWRPDPSEIGPVDGTAASDWDGLYGWHFMDAEGFLIHVIAETPNGEERRAVALLAQVDARAVRIELWRNQGQADDCWWAAIREVGR